MWLDIGVESISIVLISYSTISLSSSDANLAVDNLLSNSTISWISIFPNVSDFKLLFDKYSLLIKLLFDFSLIDGDNLILLCF